MILEDIQSQFRTFGEGLAGAREDLTGVREDVRVIKRRVGNIERDVMAIKIVIPTLATKKELQEAIAEAVAPLATKKDLRELEKRLVAIEHAR